jgi:ribosome-binding factor A
MADVKRATRVAERIREELAFALAEVVKDPGARGVIVAGVRVSDDLRHANVYVRLVSGGDDETERKRALAGLTRASGVLRREVTERAGLRFAPELRFHYDEGQDARDRIDQLLREVDLEKSGGEKKSGGERKNGEKKKKR